MLLRKGSQNAKIQEVMNLQDLKFDYYLTDNKSRAYEINDSFNELVFKNWDKGMIYYKKER